MTLTSLAVAIFLCGVQVGRGVKSDRAAEGGDIVASAALPPAATTPSQPAAAGGPPAAEPPAPAPEPDDELSYAKRLRGDQAAAPAEKLKLPPPAAPPSSTASAPKPFETPPATVAAPGPAAAAAEAGRPGAFIVQLTALKDRNEASTIVRGLVAKGYPAFVQDPAPGSPP